MNLPSLLVDGGEAANYFISNGLHAYYIEQLTLLNDLDL